MRTSTAFAKGLLAENLAQTYLTQKGYGLLAHRYKTTFGELDLVMHQDNRLVFFEVKRRRTLAQGLESITPRHRHRLWQAGEHFLQNKPKEAPWDSVQFDLIVVFSQDIIMHMENILSA